MHDDDERSFMAINVNGNMNTGYRHQLNQRHKYSVVKTIESQNTLTGKIHWLGPYSDLFYTYNDALSF